MAKLPEHAVLRIARIVACGAVEQIERHTDAHPMRYGRELPEEAFDAITERVEFEMARVLRELEIPPK